MDTKGQEPDMVRPGVTGAILVGGGSRRMGRPKAILRVPEDGPTMLERVAQVLKQCCDSVVLVGHCPAPIPASLRELECVADAGNGPLGGLAAALDSSSQSRVMLAGCDMPFMSVGIVQEVIARSIDTGLGVVPQDVRDGRMQPLHAVYLKAHLPDIECAMAAGVRSMVTAIDRLEMATWPYDPDASARAVAWSFFNVNTPGDLAVACQHDLELQWRSRGGILE